MSNEKVFRVNGKERDIYYPQKEKLEFSTAYNEECGFEEFDTHGVYFKQKRQKSSRYPI